MKTKIKLLDWSNGYELPEGIDYRNVAFTIPEYVINTLYSQSEMAIIDSFDIIDEDLEVIRKKYDQYKKKAFKPLWKKLIGKFWETTETKTYLSTNAEFAKVHWYDGNQDFAIEILEELLLLDAPDHLGLRLLLINWYPVLNNFDKMDILFQKYPKDRSNPLFLYPMALRYYLEFGANHTMTQNFIQKAMSLNISIPVIIIINSDIDGLVRSSFRPHSIEEAIFFDTINDSLWYDKDSTIEWLKEEYEKFCEKIATLSGNLP